MFKKRLTKMSYDKENEKPVLKCSICTGERVAGLKNLQTGHFEERMLISNEHDLNQFMEMYEITSIEKEY